MVLGLIWVQGYIRKVIFESGKTAPTPDTNSKSRNLDFDIFVQDFFAKSGDARFQISVAQPHPIDFSSSIRETLWNFRVFMSRKIFFQTNPSRRTNCFKICCFENHWINENFARNLQSWIRRFGRRNRTQSIFRVAYVKLHEILEFLRRGIFSMKSSHLEEPAPSKSTFRESLDFAFCSIWIVVAARVALGVWGDHANAFLCPLSAH